MTSKFGLAFAGIYVALCAYFIYTQGLFGESFIALILGMPWTLGLAFFEYFNASGSAAVVLALIPLVINTLIIYWVTARVTRS
jgi:hypothetical protein